MNASFGSDGYAFIICLGGIIALVLLTAALNYKNGTATHPASCHASAVTATKIVNVLTIIALLAPTVRVSWYLTGVHLCYALLVINAAAFVSWNFFAITDTSMHVHLLMEIFRARRISQADLGQRYNKEAIIRARIPRLIALGQMERTDGRLRLTGQTVLLGARMCAAFRRALRIPVRPPI